MSFKYIIRKFLSTFILDYLSNMALYHTYILIALYNIHILLGTSLNHTYILIGTSFYHTHILIGTSFYHTYILNGTSFYHIPITASYHTCIFIVLSCCPLHLMMGYNIGVGFSVTLQITTWTRAKTQIFSKIFHGDRK